MKFVAEVLLHGRTATGFVVPDDVVEALAGGKRPAVTVTINGYTYRSTIAVMGGRAMLPLAGEHRTAAGVAAGDQVEVDVELDTAPREVTPPAELAAAFESEPALRQAFEALSYTNRRELASRIETAKKAETRTRRVTETLNRLRGTA